MSSVSPDRLLVDLSGSTEQMGRALGVAFHAYRTRGGINYVAANHAATLPETFASLTQAVVGLSTLGRVSVPHPPSPATLRPDATSGVNRGYPASYGPKVFWKLYNAPNKASQKGAGQKLAVIAAGNLSQPRRDLLTFERRFRLPRVRWNQINVGKPSRDTSGATEFSLDTQYSTAFAPGVRSLFVYDAHSLSDRDILAAMDRFVTGNRSKQASFSAGECERVARQGGLMSGLNTVLREGAAQGQTLFAASGDDGAFCPSLIGIGHGSKWTI
ncbi:MAG: protease pro-enzyme activation domain-containing protein [Rubrobacteraceae bacterium]